MTVRLLRTERIAVDGISVRFYRLGDILNVPESLGKSLVRDGLATPDLQPVEAESELPLAHTPKAQPKPSRKREYKNN